MTVTRSLNLPSSSRPTAHRSSVTAPALVVVTSAVPSGHTVYVRPTRGAGTPRAASPSAPSGPSSLPATLSSHSTRRAGWPCEVVSIDAAAELAELRITGERRPQPMPPVVDGAIRLPNMSGHAHTRSWGQGSIVRLHDAYYRVARKPRVIGFGASIEYALVPATAEQYATRPGRVEMDDAYAARASVGSAVQTPSGEWLHVTRAVRSAYGSAEGEVFGHLHYGVGKYVAAEKAAKLNELHAPTLSRALANAPCERVSTPMPADAKVLVPRDPSFLSATGERVALVDGVILHERVGDPDQIDSCYHYVVRIDDPALVARVKRYVRSAR